MAEEVIRRQGSATDHGSFTGAAGEITVENTNWNLRIHDGATAGGVQTAMVKDFGGPTTAEVGKGAIVESGSTPDGHYVRWENGEQVCWDWHRITTSTDSAVDYAFASPAITWTFPIAFTSGVSVNFEASRGNSRCVYASPLSFTENLSLSSADYVILNGRSETSVDFGVGSTAWGFWK